MSCHVDASCLARVEGYPGLARHPHKRPAAWRQLAVWALAGLLAACSPVFDWREARPAAGLLVMFPCKPDRVTRQLSIAGAPQAMTLWSCNAGDLTFAVSQVEAAEAPRVDVLLYALRTALSGNLGGTQPAELKVEEATVAGATPHPMSQRLVLRGRRADGSPIEAQGQFFVQDLRVFQVTVIGSRLDAQALDTFFSSLKLAS